MTWGSYRKTLNAKIHRYEGNDLPGHYNKMTTNKYNKWFELLTNKFSIIHVSGDQHINVLLDD